MFKYLYKANKVNWKNWLDEGDSKILIPFRSFDEWIYFRANDEIFFVSHQRTVWKIFSPQEYLLGCASYSVVTSSLHIVHTPYW